MRVAQKWWYFFFGWLLGSYIGLQILLGKVTASVGKGRMDAGVSA